MRAASRHNHGFAARLLDHGLGVPDRLDLLVAEQVGRLAVRAEDDEPAHAAGEEAMEVRGGAGPVDCLILVEEG